MADQFQTIIEYFNNLEESHIFTSRDMKDALSGYVNESAVTSFLTLSFKMGAVDKEKIGKPIKGGPRLNFMKIRPLTEREIKGLTIYPDCIDFKKEIEANYRKISSPPIPNEPEKPITVKEHHRKKPVRIDKGDQLVTVSDYKDRLVLTIYKK